MREERQWGHYIVHADYETHKVKTLVVEPGKSLSYQRHEHRDEWWFVVSGFGWLMREHYAVSLKPGRGAHRIFSCDWHQLVNSGTEDLVVIEVQIGDKCVEEDIERK